MRMFDVRAGFVFVVFVCVDGWVLFAVVRVG